MSKIVRLTESDLVRLVKRIVQESEEGFERIDDDDFGFESPLCPSCKGEGCEECDGSGMKRNSIFPEDKKDGINDVEDYGFDVENEFNDDEEFQNKMRFRERVRRNLPGSVGMGSGKRWDKDSEKEYNPIRPDDLPLDKFLKSKYNKM